MLVTVGRGVAPFRGALSGALNFAKAADLAAAATTDIGGATGNYVVITGGANITALGTAPSGAVRICRFAGSATLVHNASALVMPNATNQVTAAGDMALFVSEGGGAWRCLTYLAASVVWAPLASPGFTGTPTAPTQASTDNSTALANTQFVHNYSFPLSGGTITGPSYVAPSTGFATFSLLGKSGGGASFIISTQASFNAQLVLQRNQVTRWVLAADGVTETGGSTGGGGSDVGLFSFNNDGSFRGTPVYISRNTGVMTLSATPAFPTPAAGDNSTNGATTGFVRNGFATYSAGTFTPVASFATPGNLSTSYSTQTGRYFQIGNMMHVEIALSFIPTFSSATGDFLISGLPATCQNVTAALGVSESQGLTFGSGQSMINGVVPAAGAVAKLRAFGSGSTPAYLQASNFTSGTAVTLRLTGFYEVTGYQ